MQTIFVYSNKPFALFKRRDGYRKLRAELNFTRNLPMSARDRRRKRINSLLNFVDKQCSGVDGAGDNNQFRVINIVVRAGRARRYDKMYVHEPICVTCEFRRRVACTTLALAERARSSVRPNATPNKNRTLLLHNSEIHEREMRLF